MYQLRIALSPMSSNNEIFLHSERADHPPRQRKGRMFNVYRTVEPAAVAPRNAPRSPNGQPPLQPRARYSYSTVPSAPIRVPPEQARPYRQLYRKPYRPRPAVEDESDSEADDDDDEDPEVANAQPAPRTATATSNRPNAVTPRVSTKRDLSRRHPTRSLAIGSLQRNCILASGGAPDLTAASTSTAHGSSATQRPPIVTAICELTHIWNVTRRLGQRALLFFFSVDILPAHHTESRALLTAALAGKDKKAAKDVLSEIISLLLLMLANSKVTSGRSRNARIATAVYETYTTRFTQNTRIQGSNKYGLSALFVPLATAMAKEIVDHWSLRTADMVKQASCIVFHFIISQNAADNDPY